MKYYGIECDGPMFIENVNLGSTPWQASFESRFVYDTVTKKAYYGNNAAWTPWGSSGTSGSNGAAGSAGSSGTAWVVGTTINIQTTQSVEADNNSQIYFKNTVAGSETLGVVWHSTATAADQSASPHGRFVSGKVFNAVYNDIADFLELDEYVNIEYGSVYVRYKDGKVAKSVSNCQLGIIGIATDTYGYGLGIKKVKEGYQLPVSVGGFVLARVDREYDSGTPLTSDPDGRLTYMNIEQKMMYPERLIAIYYKAEKELFWNDIEVKDRHWVKVK